VLAYRQTYRIKRNWESRTKPTYLWPTGFSQMCQNRSVGERRVFSSGAGTTGNPHAEERSWTLTCTGYPAVPATCQMPILGSCCCFCSPAPSPPVLAVHPLGVWYCPLSRNHLKVDAELLISWGSHKLGQRTDTQGKDKPYKVTERWGPLRTWVRSCVVASQRDGCLSQA